MHEVILPLPQYAFMAWCSVIARGHLYLYSLHWIMVVYMFFKMSSAFINYMLSIIFLERMMPAIYITQFHYLPFLLEASCSNLTALATFQTFSSKHNLFPSQMVILVRSWLSSVLGDIDVDPMSTFFPLLLSSWSVL